MNAPNALLMLASLTPLSNAKNAQFLYRTASPAKAQSNALNATRLLSIPKKDHAFSAQISLQHASSVLLSKAVPNVSPIATTWVGVNVIFALIVWMDVSPVIVVKSA